MTLSTRKAGGIALRLLIWLPLLLWGAWQWGRDYADLFRPLYTTVLSYGLDGLRFGDIQIVRTHEYLLRVPYVVEAMRVIGGHVIPRNLDGFLLVPVYSILAHPIVLAAAALAWPGLRWKERWVRLLISLPVLVVLEAVDTPLVIYSFINKMLALTYDPGYLTAKPMYWLNLLEGGGRFALSIAAAVVAAELHKGLNRLAVRGRSTN